MNVLRKTLDRIRRRQIADNLKTNPNINLKTYLQQVEVMSKRAKVHHVQLW